MLELWLRRHGMAHEDVVANFVRFHNSTSLSFPASEIEALQTEPAAVPRDAQALGAALQSAQLKYVRMTPAFMGLLGTNGALPAHYTERIAAHALYQRDDGPRAFLDAFSNRSLALFYEAWRKYRLELKYQSSGKDGFMPLLLSLAGLGQGALRKRLSSEAHGVRDESLAYFASMVRQKPASASQVARVLAEYFGHPIRIEQFIGCWYDVPAMQQTSLGGANAVLGASALAGERVWQRDLRLRLVIGPLDHASYASFLPGGAAANALKNLLAMFTGVTLEYEVQLVLRHQDVRGACLDGESIRLDGSGVRVGWDSFLPQDGVPRDRADLRYELHTI
ncbi:type VI secretion system baseplate subunit TssG [Pseudoduganella ginsengisoli]